MQTRSCNPLPALRCYVPRHCASFSQHARSIAQRASLSEVETSSLAVLEWGSVCRQLEKGAHTTVPQQAAAAGPWVGGLAAPCSPGQGTPCPWLAELPAVATNTAPVGATCPPQCAACSALHCSPCPATCQAAVLAWPEQLGLEPCLCPWWAGWAQLPAQPWCACCSWLAGELGAAGVVPPAWLPVCTPSGLLMVQLLLTGLLASHC
ncbi:hypothetical protein HaLaN_05697 [Haematococcus lacustris]|uniref:Uncharacterized protein n=1 Tax=Haematococcus lacustris TaxID=44745 RepID=A0A699YLK4_HAELA|nr:hypothetical protein HaLaN_05697 [Haematococcus lacustris]